MKLSEKALELNICRRNCEPASRLDQDAVRRKKPEHAIQRVGVEPGALGKRGRGRALLAERVGDAEVCDHVQAARGDVAVRELGENHRKLPSGRVARWAPPAAASPGRLPLDRFEESAL